MSLILQALFSISQFPRTILSLSSRILRILVHPYAIMYKDPELRVSEFVGDNKQPDKMKGGEEDWPITAAVSLLPPEDG
jgi:hypothetical protein